MDAKEFAYFREKLNKTQKQLAQLLGTSLKAVHSYEQSWRPIPAHVERQIFFLFHALPELTKRRNHAGLSRNVLLKERENVQPGSLKSDISAGLLTEQYVTLRPKKTGKKR